VAAGVSAGTLARLLARLFARVLANPLAVVGPRAILPTDAPRASSPPAPRCRLLKRPGKRSHLARAKGGREPKRLCPPAAVGRPDPHRACPSRRHGDPRVRIPGHYTSRVAGCTRRPCNRHIGRGVGSQVCSDAGAAIAMAPKPWAQTMVKSSCRRRGGKVVALTGARGKPWLAGSLVRSNSEGPAPGTPAAGAARPCFVPLPANVAGPGASQLGSVAATNPAKGLAYLRIGFDRRSRERPTHDHPP
jgi:hypothetical protein